LNRQVVLQSQTNQQRIAGKHRFVHPSLRAHPVTLPLLIYGEGKWSLVETSTLLPSPLFISSSSPLRLFVSSSSPLRLLFVSSSSQLHLCISSHLCISNASPHLLRTSSPSPTHTHNTHNAQHTILIQFYPTSLTFPRPI
jgi:hypothetical protein